jgi:hypothetical protein
MSSTRIYIYVYTASSVNLHKACLPVQALPSWFCPVLCSFTTRTKASYLVLCYGHCVVMIVYDLLPSAYLSKTFYNWVCSFGVELRSRVFAGDLRQQSFLVQGPAGPMNMFSYLTLWDSCNYTLWTSIHVNIIQRPVCTTQSTFCFSSTKTIWTMLCMETILFIRSTGSTEQNSDNHTRDYVYKKQSITRHAMRTKCRESHKAPCEQNARNHTNIMRTKLGELYEAPRTQNAENHTSYHTDKIQKRAM